MSHSNRASSVRTTPTKPAFDTNGAGHERLTEIQRGRIIAAAIDVACETGAGNTTVAHIVSRAGVSRRTFYEVFQDCEDCLLAAFDGGVNRVAHCTIAAYESANGWRERMRAALVALLGLFEAEPELARFLVVETLGAGPVALRRRQQVLADVTAVVQEGAVEARSTGSSPLAAEAVVGALFSVIHDRLLDPEPPRLADLTNPLMSIVVLPFLGPATARRELQMPVTRRLTQAETKRSPAFLGGGQVRLTYRTVRTLEAVAVNPGSSNRRIADAAGIADQGQVSKLLARLQKLGLVENRGAQGSRGEPNAWRLTETGEEVRDAIAPPVSTV
jgi:AcrR family transcriptional regulator/DNA-binding MarR family transcriptional regulator